MRFKQFYLKEDLGTSVELSEVLPYIKEMGDKPLMFRGHKLKNPGTFNLVLNDREPYTFHGKASEQELRTKKLLDTIKITKPVFTATDPDKASLFGSVYVVVPKGKYSTKYSRLIDDMTHFMANKSDVEDIAKTYKPGIIPNHSEILLKVSGYYLIALDELFKDNELIQGKFGVYPNEKESKDKYKERVNKSIKTYSDLSTISRMIE